VTKVLWVSAPTSRRKAQGQSANEVTIGGRRANKTTPGKTGGRLSGKQANVKEGKEKGALKPMVADSLELHAPLQQGSNGTDERSSTAVLMDARGL